MDSESQHYPWNHCNAMLAAILNRTVVSLYLYSPVTEDKTEIRNIRHKSVTERMKCVDTERRRGLDFFVFSSFAKPAVSEDVWKSILCISVKSEKSGLSFVTCTQWIILNISLTSLKHYHNPETFFQGSDMFLYNGSEMVCVNLHQPVACMLSFWAPQVSLYRLIMSFIRCCFSESHLRPKTCGCHMCRSLHWKRKHCFKLKIMKIITLQEILFLIFVYVKRFSIIYLVICFCQLELHMTHRFIIFLYPYGGGKYTRACMSCTFKRK